MFKKNEVIVQLEALLVGNLSSELVVIRINDYPEE